SRSIFDPLTRRASPVHNRNLGNRSKDLLKKCRRCSSINDRMEKILVSNATASHFNLCLIVSRSVSTHGNQREYSQTIDIASSLSLMQISVSIAVHGQTMTLVREELCLLGRSIPVDRCRISVAGQERRAEGC